MLVKVFINNKLIFNIFRQKKINDVNKKVTWPVFRVQFRKKDFSGRGKIWDIYGGILNGLKTHKNG